MRVPVILVNPREDWMPTMGSIRRRRTERGIRGSAREMASWYTSETEEFQAYIMALMKSFPCLGAEDLIEITGEESAPLGWKEREFVDGIVDLENCDQFQTYYEAWKGAMREQGAWPQEEP